MTRFSKHLLTWWLVLTQALLPLAQAVPTVPLTADADAVVRSDRTPTAANQASFRGRIGANAAIGRGTIYFPTIQPGGEITRAFTVAGALPDQTPPVQIGWSGGLTAGIFEKQAWVSAPNEVSITFVNRSASAVRPASLICSAAVAVFDNRVDPDADAYVTRAKANGGTLSGSYTESYVRQQYSQWVTTAKTAGYWSKIRDCGFFLAWTNASGAATKLKDGSGGTTPSLTRNGTDPVITATGESMGAKPNGTNCWWGTGVTVDQSNACFVVMLGKYTSAVGGNGGGEFNTSPSTGDARMELSTNTSALGLRQTLATDVLAQATRFYQHGQNIAYGGTVTFTPAPVTMFGGLRVGGVQYYNGCPQVMYAICDHLTDAEHLALARANEELASAFGADSGKRKFVPIGDSVTKGQGPTIEMTQRWSALVAASKNMEEINFGMPNSRLRSDVTSASPAVSAYNRRLYPGLWKGGDYIAAMIGTNDATNDASTNTADFQAKLEAWVDAQIAVTGDPQAVVLCTTPIRGSTTTAQSKTNKTAYDSIIATVATNKGTRFADVNSAMVTDGRGDALLGSSGDVHPNTAGCVVIANCINAVLP